MLPRPWFRKDKKAWYLQVSRNQQKRLGKTKTEADIAYREWVLDQGGMLPANQSKRLTVAEIAQEFLDDSKANNDARTYEFYRYFVAPFVTRFGAAVAATFPPLTFQKWLNEHKSWKGSRRNAVVAIRRLFNWAVKRKLIPENPILSVEKPPKRRRNRIMSSLERESVYKAIRDEQFREFLFAMLETGCRPSEVAKVSANQVSHDSTMWIFEEHKTDHTGQPRIVYLTPAMQELTRRLVSLYPTGPLFRSTRRFGGVRKPWTRNGIRCRFKRLRQKFRKERLKLPSHRRHEVPDLSGLTAYVLRHTYATQALANGVSAPMVAALLGHRSTKMLDEHYSHLDQRGELLTEAAMQASRRV
jgi:integrase